MQFLTQKEYILTAKKNLSKYGVLNPSNDQIGEVVEYLIRADYKYKSDIGNREGFRMLYAKYGVLKAIRKNKQQNNKRDKSLDFTIKSENRNNKYLDTLPSREKTPDFYVFFKEVLDKIKINGILIERDRDILLDRFLNMMTYEEISQKYSLSKQASKDSIIKSCKILRKKLNA